MKKVLFAFLANLLLVSCSDSVQTETSEQKLINKSNILDKPAKINVQTDDLHSKILGAWTNHQTENATFDIQKDSIFYVDALESYSYKLAGNKIIIQFPDYKYEAVLTWLGDTLVMNDKDNGASNFTRFTE